MHARFSVTGFLLTLILFVYSRNIPFLVGQATADRSRCLSSGGFAQDGTSRAATEKSSAESTAHQQVLNATVGFEKVYTISLPERSDRRDAFSLQARLSNISFEFRDGVLGSDISPKALPLTFDQDEGTKGCWRAHLNVFQEMVRNNVQSALIFEDDADWDVAFRHQMVLAADAVNFVTTSPPGPESPFGNDWDILSLGHCAAVPQQDTENYFVIPQDPTVLPPAARLEWEKPDMGPWEEGELGDTQTRLYFRTAWLSCLTAYAVSLRGAQKILYRQSMVPWNEPVDNGIGTMCKNGELDMSCVSVFPTLVGISKPAGSANRGSDIRDQDNVYIHEQGWSEMVLYSIRQNVPRLLTGLKTFVATHSPAPDKTMSQLTSAVGHGEYLVDNV